MFRPADRSRITRLTRRLAPLVVLAGLALPTVASADVETYAPGALRAIPSQSVTKGSGKGNTVTPSVSGNPADGIIECNVPWANVQGGVSGYVIGGCQNGTRWTRTATSTYLSYYFSFGYIPGAVSGCGWIETQQSIWVGVNQTTACGYGTPSKQLTDFASSYNNSGIYYDSAGKPIGNPCTRSDDKTKCVDGTPATLRTDCTAYANFRPWSSGQNPASPLGVLKAQTQVLWRYKGLYDAANGTGRYVMARLPGVNPGQGNWAFIARGCFESLPYETAAAN